MSKYLVEIPDDERDDLNVLIEMAIEEGLNIEPSIDFIVSEIVMETKFDENVIIDDKLIDKKSDEIIDSMADVFNIHKPMYASRIKMLKETIENKMKEVFDNVHTN